MEYKYVGRRYTQIIIDTYQIGRIDTIRRSQVKSNTWFHLHQIANQKILGPQSQHMNQHSKYQHNIYNAFFIYRLLSAHPLYVAGSRYSKILVSLKKADALSLQTEKVKFKVSLETFMESWDPLHFQKKSLVLHRSKTYKLPGKTRRQVQEKVSRICLHSTRAKLYMQEYKQTILEFENRLEFCPGKICALEKQYVPV